MATLHTSLPLKHVTKKGVFKYNEAFRDGSSLNELICQRFVLAQATAVSEPWRFPSWPCNCFLSKESIKGNFYDIASAVIENENSQWLYFYNLGDQSTIFTSFILRCWKDFCQEF